MMGYPEVSATRQQDSLRRLTLLVYILYALAPLTGGFTALVAIIINHVKRADAAGTLYESHFTWQIRTFWWGLLWSVLSMLTMWFGLGVFIWVVTGIWAVYRLVKGWLYWNDHRPLPY